MQAPPIGVRQMPNPADRLSGAVGMCVGRKSGTQIVSAVGYKDTSPVVEHEPGLIDCKANLDRPSFAEHP